MRKKRPERDKNLAAVMLGRLGGLSRSAAKRAAARKNVAKATAARRAKRTTAAR